MLDKYIYYVVSYTCQRGEPRTTKEQKEMDVKKENLKKIVEEVEILTSQTLIEIVGKKNNVVVFGAS